MSGISESIPGYSTQSIIGWRGWRFSEKEDALLPLAVRGPAWTPGENKATCSLQKGHTIPNLGCDCGFNAYYTPEQLDLNRLTCDSSDTEYVELKKRKRNIIEGAIIAKGKMQLHDDGFRAEYSEIIGIIDNGLPCINFIQEIYSVPVFSDTNELIQYTKNLQERNSILHFGEQKISSIKTFSNGRLHSSLDMPAFQSTEKQEWRRRGILHRSNDLPAVVYKNGHKEYWENGLLHRENNLPAVLYADGSKEYWHRGLCHRDDGPAIDKINGQKIWKSFGKYHCDSGPAIVQAYGRKDYWLNHIHYRSKSAWEMKLTEQQA